MAAADNVSRIRVFCLWTWAIWGFVLTFWPYMAHPGISFDQAVKPVYDDAMRAMHELPETTAPPFAKTTLGFCSLTNSQFYGGLMFFLAMVQTEEFQVRCCQFLAFDRLVLCPLAYFYSAYQWGIQVELFAYMSILCAFIFGFLGFVAPAYWAPKETSTTLKSSGQWACLIDWITELWLWGIWIFIFQMFWGPIAQMVSTYGSMVIDQATAEFELEQMSLFPKTEPFHSTHFTKMTIMVLNLQNTEMSAAVLFFLATMRTKYFRICVCLWNAVDFILNTPFWYCMMYWHWGLATADLNYSDQSTFFDMINGSFSLLLAAIAMYLSSTSTRAKEVSVSEPLL